jgi:homoserine O-succinyltransferase
MPVTIDERRVPPSWASRNARERTAAKNGHRSAAAEPVRIALVNNMPDSALEDTELQFCELLENAAGGIPVELHLFSLPDLARGDRGRQHIAAYYSSAADLSKSRFDGAIITGTEPLQPDLRDEPYWSSLAGVLDWAAENTASTVLSCLAAHAGVLYSDAIARNRLPDKQFGVFSHQHAANHELTRGIPESVRIPHSRWNEVREADLLAGGYTILTKAPKAGVDLFVKKRKNSLFVHFQGHPEYSTLTLLKEYRRDIRRYLRQERETYPTMPEGYFGSHARQILNEFRAEALKDRNVERIADFPEAAIVDSLEHSWKSSAAGIYRNWLNYLLRHKPSAVRPSEMQAAHD